MVTKYISFSTNVQCSVTSTVEVIPKAWNILLGAPPVDNFQSVRQFGLDVDPGDRYYDDNKYS